jgi:hypothetical protein
MSLDEGDTLAAIVPVPREDREINEVDGEDAPAPVEPPAGQPQAEATPPPADEASDE